MTESEDNIINLEKLGTPLLNNYNYQMKKKKILFIGKEKCGKSSIIFRYKENLFLQIYEPTLQNSTKQIINLKNDLYEMEIIDMDGQSEFTIFTYNTYGIGVNGYYLVYSIDDRTSFLLLKKLNYKLNSLVGKNVPRILVGNKIDNNKKREVSFEEGFNFSKKLNCPFFECSAKTGKNINETFEKLLVEIIKREVNFDEKNIILLSLFKFLVHHEKIFRIFFYILMILNIFYPIFITILLYLNKLFPVNKFIPLLSLFIWIIVLSSIAFFGMCQKNYNILKVVIIGFFISIIFEIGMKVYCNLFDFPGYDNKLKINLNFAYGPLLTIYLIFTIFILLFSLVFAKIYKDELDLFLL